MDALFFRRLAYDLLPLLYGARIEKIFRPNCAPLGIISTTKSPSFGVGTAALSASSLDSKVPSSVFQTAPKASMDVLILHAHGKKQTLVLYASRRTPLLFLSTIKPPNPPSPPAATMRIRKHIQNRRVARVLCNWQTRQIVLGVAGGEFPWLLLDMVHGISLEKQLPDTFTTLAEYNPAWEIPQIKAQNCEQEKAFSPSFFIDPNFDAHDVILPHESWADEREILAALAQANNTDKERNGEKARITAFDFAKYPYITPALRRTLQAPDAPEEPDARALLIDLQDAPQGDVFVYRKTDAPCRVSAWPLAPSEYKGMTEKAEESALNAASQLGEALVFAGMGNAEEQSALAPQHAALKRIQKTLRTLDAEEERMKRLVALQADALALQSVLYRFSSEERAASLSVPMQNSETQEFVERVITLDASMSIRDNMAHLFAKAAKGKRGLDALQTRRAALNEDVLRVRRGEEAQAVRRPVLQQKGAENAKAITSASSKNGKNSKNKFAIPEKLATRFRSSDGFLLLRGRSSLGNDAIIRQASPCDIWFHCEDGPSSHVILHRDYPNQPVPERTMQEAAILSGLHSCQKEEKKARMFCAEVRHLRKVKGAAAGAVTVNEVLCSLVVELDKSLEETLRIIL